MQDPDLKYVKPPSKILIIKVKTNNNKKIYLHFGKNYAVVQPPSILFS